MEFQSAILHISYADADGEYLRHWSPESELYAPADVLFQYLWQGWRLKNLVAVEVVYYGGYRRSVIHYFTIEKGNRFIEIPIVATPPVLRLVEELELTTVYAWTAQPTFTRQDRRRYPWHRRSDAVEAAGIVESAEQETPG